MADATQYNPQVSFRIKISKVFLLTAEGVNPSTYRLSYAVEGLNDLGAMETVLTSYFLVDYIGIYFTILAIGSGTLDVEDSFRLGECPCSNSNAIIEKSVGDGLAPFLAPSSLQFLHPLAKDNINRWNLDILWKNGGGDPLGYGLLQFISGSEPATPDANSQFLYMRSWGETPDKVTILAVKNELGTEIILTSLIT
jgi:hypothetical protein